MTIIINTLFFNIYFSNRVYYNRFGDSEVFEDVVDPRNGDDLCYTLTGLDPADPMATVDLDNPLERPPAYSVWVVAVYEGTFMPPANGRKKRQISGLEETVITVESEPSVLPYQNGLTGKPNVPECRHKFG